MPQKVWSLVKSFIISSVIKFFSKYFLVDKWNHQHMEPHLRFDIVLIYWDSWLQQISSSYSMRQSNAVCSCSQFIGEIFFCKCLKHFPTKIDFIYLLKTSLFFSVTYHIFISQTRRTYEFCSFLDRIGILAHLVALYLTAFYFGFECSAVRLNEFTIYKILIVRKLIRSCGDTSIRAS